MSIIVEGNLINIDSDESDSDIDDYEENYKNKDSDDIDINEISNEQNNDDDEDDEEEEREVFDSNKSNQVYKVINKKKNSNSKSIDKVDANKEVQINESNSLLSAISVAISTIENESSNNNSKVNTSVNVVINDKANDDIFGITYKPFKKKPAEYNAIAPIEFDDNSEFNQHTSLLANITIDDDEFEFDENKQSNSDAIDLALSRASNKEDIIIELADVTTTTDTTNPELTNTDNEIDIKSIRESSKAAFNELTSIYSSGLGDLGVRLLDNNVSTTSTTENKSSIKPSKNLQDEVIEEGDEELEIEEEIRQAEEILNLKYEQIELENEWNSLSNTNTNTRSYKFDKLSSYQETLSIFESYDLSKYQSMIITTEEKSNWSVLSGYIPLKFDNSAEKLEFPFLLAQVDYDSSDIVHFNILQSIYEVLINRPETSTIVQLKGCPVIGNHWEKIGFQGIDPCTDLNRSMKMFAVLQAHYLIDQDYYFARDLHELSQSENTNHHNYKPKKGEIDPSWPFMCVSVMFTRETIQALRRGALNKKCNQRQDVLSVCNDYYRSCFYEFARLLIAKPNVHHAEHLKTLRDFSSSNPAQLYRNYRSAIKKFKSQTDLSNKSVLSLLSFQQNQTVKSTKKSVNKPIKQEEIITFDNLEDIADDTDADKSNVWSSESTEFVNVQPTAIDNQSGGYVPAYQQRISGTYIPPTGSWKDGLCNCFSNL
eukprot:gene20196-26214_t